MAIWESSCLGGKGDYQKALPLTQLTQLTPATQLAHPPSVASCRRAT